MKLSDIARLAGVSVTTASYVINGKAEQQHHHHGHSEENEHGALVAQDVSSFLDYE